ITETMASNLDINIHSADLTILGLFDVELHEKQPQSLAQALNRLFVTVGTPSFVKFGPGYSVAEAELKNRNKRLRLRSTGACIGRYVTG
ncbi:MAG: hypothetical protein AAB506_03300, partial [Patescibacteria group bacterium]